MAIWQHLSRPSHKTQQRARLGRSAVFSPTTHVLRASTHSYRSLQQTRFLTMGRDGLRSRGTGEKVSKSIFAMQNFLTDWTMLLCCCCGCCVAMRVACMYRRHARVIIARVCVCACSPARPGGAGQPWHVPRPHVRLCSRLTFSLIPLLTLRTMPQTMPRPAARKLPWSRSASSLPKGGWLWSSVTRHTTSPTLPTCTREVRT